MRWFAVVRDGSLWSVMQRCPEAVKGACEHAGACECIPDAAGPLWLSRGSGLSLADAVSMAQALDARFDRYVLAWSGRHARQAAKACVSRRLAVVSPVRAAFVVVPAAECWEVWRVCADVVAVGECRSALWCSCVHSDCGPLRGCVEAFSSVAEAEGRRALLQSEVGAWRRVGFDASLLGGLCELPSGVSHVVEAVASAFDDWGDDVPY